MVLSRKQIDELIKTVSLTRPDELTCDECLKDLAEFAEHSLSGKSIPEGLQAVEHHLAICAECQEEYKALLTALKQTE
jgi:uncharacterized protein with PIN domain